MYVRIFHIDPKIYHPFTQNNRLPQKAQTSLQVTEPNNVHVFSAQGHPKKSERITKARPKLVGKKFRSNCGHFHEALFRLLCFT